MHNWLLLIFLMCWKSLVGQENAPHEAVALEFSHGFPDGVRFLTKDRYEWVLKKQYITAGPFAAKVQYRFSPRFSAGLFSSYAHTTILGKTETYTFNLFGFYMTTRSFRFYGEFDRLRFVPFLSYHFRVVKKFEPYILAGAGYVRWRLNIDSEIPVNAVIPELPPPVCFRLEGGARYRITNAVALSAALAAGGGPILTGGVVWKIFKRGSRPHQLE